MASLLLALLMAGTTHANEVSDSSLGQGGGNLPTVVVEAQRLSSPTVSETGAAVYGVSAEDIEKLPTGAQASITDVLAQMPSVAIDQNQQIHIRNTEGPQFQYQINGFLVPLDINTNPPFISMLDTLFVDRLDLRVGLCRLAMAMQRAASSTSSRRTAAVSPEVNSASLEGSAGPFPRASNTRPAKALSRAMSARARRGATPPSAARTTSCPALYAMAS